MSLDLQQSQVAPMEELGPLMRELLSSGQSVHFSPKGISMLPMLREGKDSVVLSPLPARLKRYDIPLYLRQDGTYVLHRIVELGDTFTCLGDNQFVLEPGVTREQMIGVVTGFYREGRYHSVKSLPYRMYRCLWYRTRHLRHFWRRGVRWLRRHL